MNITYIIPIALAVLIAIYAFSVYNKFVKQKNKVAEAFNLMDIYLLRRHDLIPLLLSVVKGYMQHESDTLAKATAARTQSESISDKVDAETQISDVLSKIIVNAEAYPALKSDSHFTELQSQLIALESEIASSRRYYNGSVRQFNSLCQMFPTNIIANILAYKPMKMFEANANERNNISINH